MGSNPIADDNIEVVIDTRKDEVIKEIDNIDGMYYKSNKSKL